MKKITPAVVNQADVTVLQAYPAARQSSMWENSSGRPPRFKAELTADLLIKQSSRCAYCCTLLRETKPHRDHIAPKGAKFHPEFTFEVKNLVLACFYCNTERKGETDTVSAKAPQYESCQFSIVHPILDDPERHLKFVGHRGNILIQTVDGSAKGQTTIDLFDLASPELAKGRAKDALFDDDVAHLQGRWKRLLEQVALSPLPQRTVLKFRS